VKSSTSAVDYGKSVKVFGDLAVFILINSYRAKLNIQKKITAFSRTGEK
jgi:hypothetical protein